VQVVRRYPPFIKAMKKRGIDDVAKACWVAAAVCVAVSVWHDALPTLVRRFVLIHGAPATSMPRTIRPSGWQGAKQLSTARPDANLVVPVAPCCGCARRPLFYYRRDDTPGFNLYANPIEGMRVRRMCHTCPCRPCRPCMSPVPHRVHAHALC
jgi:hypothetical protein